MNIPTTEFVFISNFWDAPPALYGKLYDYICILLHIGPTLGVYIYICIYSTCIQYNLYLIYTINIYAIH